ncbi:MAG TPA: T9SS type A sorting domain-containing protein [Flavipsychrobacter sp.]|nr:T9SS type A sorting domain-containing protein [Flavipsychrobacter sp.]
MKKLLLSGLLFFCLSDLSAQQTYTYKFGGNFLESSGNGPALQQICTGHFLFENLPDFNINQQVYHFDNNCGFSFNDAAGFIAAGSYTIELYFKMAGLASWKRVIDFKSRTTDKGCYVLNGNMNFYNIATSAGTPFLQDEYSHYVITRDGVTKQVVMYGDGNHYITFTDNGGDAVYDANKALSFFQDDLVVANEASEGTIALLKIHNYAMDSTNVKNSFDSLSGTLTHIRATEKNTIQTHLFPNPAHDRVNITLPVHVNTTYSYQLFDAIGRIVATGTLNSGNNSVAVSLLPQGVYNLTIHDGKGNAATERFMIH